MTNTPTTHKFVAVLNKKIEPGRVLNALGHMALGFGEADQMRQLTKKFSLWK